MNKNLYAAPQSLVTSNSLLDGCQKAKVGFIISTVLIFLNAYFVFLFLGADEYSKTWIFSLACVAINSVLHAIIAGYSLHKLGLSGWALGLVSLLLLPPIGNYLLHMVLSWYSVKTKWFSVA